MSDIPEMRPCIRCLPGRDKRLRSGHPWLYSNEICMDDAARRLSPGTPVTVIGSDGRALGVASFNPHSLIAARVLDRNAAQRIDTEFLLRHLERAHSLRQHCFRAPYYRLVHAEADGLPGLVIDRFDGTVVVQPNSAGMDHLLPSILDALDRVVAPEAVVLRADSAARSLEGLGNRVEVLRGKPPSAHPVLEDDARFFADLSSGQKTGWFFDQRDNRSAVATLATGRRVLDLYTHTGGFAVRCARAGADRIIGIDRSAVALALAEQAATANGIADRCRFLKTDVFTALDQMATDGQRFDIVVADPPAFAKSRKDVPVATRAYRKLACRTAGLVAPGGFLCLTSCSHAITPETFGDAVARGLNDAGRSGRIIRCAGAGADHPVHPHLPETAYLKCLLLFMA